MSDKCYSIVRRTSASGIIAKVYAKERGKNVFVKEFRKAKLYNRFEDEISAYCAELEKRGYIREYSDIEKLLDSMTKEEKYLSVTA